MMKTGSLLASMALGVLVACGVAVLAAGPGVGQTATVTLVGAGDIASCSQSNDSATARLLSNIPGTVFTLGDNVYPSGTADRFRNCYDPTWGRYKARTKPSLGNHDYTTNGASAYFDYFGARAGARGKGYYSYDRGAWHIVALNSNCEKIGGCGRRSAQGRWLRRDLANHPSRCTLAYFHHPLYASGTGTDTPEVRPFWNILYNRGADVILSGHAHRYERFRPITPSGDPDPQNGIRQFIAGTGGAPGGVQYGPNDPNMQVKKRNTPGVLRLNLRATSYTWKFVPIAGETFTDSGSDSCH
jgi:acid phosphatase type 7